MDFLFSSIEFLHNECYILFVEYPIAVPLITFMVFATIFLIISRLKTTSPKEITAEIRREIKNKVDNVKDFVGVGTKPRFRKRDKIYFYGKKIMRKVQANIPSRPVPSRQLARRLARKFLGKSDRDVPQLKVIEPPPEYLQEDLMPTDSSVPLEFLIMLRNIRVFGYFDMHLFLELCKSIKTITLDKGQMLFKVGEIDDNIFMVQTGHVAVNICEDGGKLSELKRVSSGESIISLLSFCDVLTGHPQPYKTVSCVALEDSIIMKFPVKSFEDIFKMRPDLLVRVVQIVMVRLMRVTFMALHFHLGLSSELMSLVPRRHSHGTILLPSPVKGRRDVTDKTDIMDESETGERKLHIRKISLLDPKDDEESILTLATEKLKDILHLESDEILRDKVSVRTVQEGEFLAKQDSMQDTALFYILSGNLVVSQHSVDGEEEVKLFMAHPGDLVGGLAVLSGDPSFFSIRAKHNSCVGSLSKDTFYAVIQQNPHAALHVANTVIMRMSPFVRQIDFALDWDHLEAGRALYKQGEIENSIYIVLSGRLRSVVTHPNGRKEVVGEFTKGDLIGIVELLTQSERGTTVMAVRDSELAKIPEGLFNVIKMKHPIVMARMIKLLGQRILGSWKSSSRDYFGLKVDQPQKINPRVNFSTVAIVPISEDVPLTQFTLELYHSTLAIGTASRLTSDYVVKSLGTSIWEKANEYQLASWLASIEDSSRVTFYQCDPSLTVWTTRCIRQADVIITVGLAENEPTVGKIEKHVEALAIRTQKVLVLLHREDGPNPTGTVKWLNMRSWCHSHHHIRAPKRVFAKKSQTKIVEYYIEKVFTQQPSVHSDFSRVARVLTGTSIGLVLGGGGARGAAHVGMIKALQVAGVPIDMIGGVSIGAFIGALFCMDKDVTSVTQKARDWSMKMTSKLRIILDLTYPYVSMFSGAGFNSLIRGSIGDVNIEDLWLPYFTLTTNITDSSARIHTHGSTWKYVRASMSLSGYMPPICDPLDGHLLLDGGYVNNLPADVMHNRFNIDTILAIDVGSQYENVFTNYGDHLSGWNLLLRSTFPFKYFFRSELKVPNMYDIQSRLSYVTCTRQLEELKTCDYCEYIRPPIDKYLTLQFGLFDEIREIGYQHGKTYFAGMTKSGRTVEQVYKIRMEKSLNDEILNQDLNLLCAPAGFTDLAQMVKSVNKADESKEDCYSSEDIQSGYASEPHFFSGDADFLNRARRHRTGSLSDNDLNKSTDDSVEDDEESDAKEDDNLEDL